jgi:hypothetical protein
VDHNPDDNNFEPRSWWQLHLPALLRFFTRLEEEEEEEEADSGFHKTRSQEEEEEEEEEKE